MLIKLVPRVCEQLIDQSLCEKAVNICGADTSPELCTLKLIGKSAGSVVGEPDPSLIVKTLYNFQYVREKVGHHVMQGGHDFLHTFAKDLIQNIGGDGKVHAVGGFISKVLGGSL